MARNSVRTVENRDLDRPLWIFGPSIQLGLVDPQEAAGCVQPERMIIVFKDRVNRMARQSVVAAKRANPAGFSLGLTRLRLRPRSYHPHPDEDR